MPTGFVLPSCTNRPVQNLHGLGETIQSDALDAWRTIGHVLAFKLKVASTDADWSFANGQDTVAEFPLKFSQRAIGCAGHSG